MKIELWKGDLLKATMNGESATRNKYYWYRGGSLYLPKRPELP